MTTSRGSLKQMVALAAEMFKQQRFDTLAITCCERGKYYSLLTPDQVADHYIKLISTSDRVVLHCTARELKSVVLNEQLKLFSDPT